MGTFTSVTNSFSNYNNVKIHAFIFNQEGHSADAIKLEESLSNKIFKVTVINRDEKNNIKHWVNIGNKKYFGEQFEKAIELFDGDIFFNIQADVKNLNQNWQEIIDSAIKYYKKYNYAVYAPNIDLTFWSNNKISIVDSYYNINDDNLNLVINTDCSCWFINKEILKEFKLNFSQYLKDVIFGWPIDAVMCAIGFLKKMPVLRDNNFKLFYPIKDGYNIVEKGEIPKQFLHSLNDFKLIGFLSRILNKNEFVEYFNEYIEKYKPTKIKKLKDTKLRTSDIDLHFKSFRTHNGCVGPFYNKNKNIEEYFYGFYLKNRERFEKTGYYYIPVFWTDTYLFKTSNEFRDLQLNIRLLPKDKQYFVVTQHAIAPKEVFLNIKTDIIKFSAGGKIKNPIPIPLICEDTVPTPSTQNNKDIFCSFVGSLNTHYCRNRMFESLSGNSDYVFHTRQTWSAIVEKEDQQAFINITSRSKFTLCPRGFGPTSWRLYEAMQLNSVPVYIYDEPHLPYTDKIDWRSICVMIHVNDIDNIDNVLKSISEDEYCKMLARIREIYSEFFNLEYMCEYILSYIEKLPQMKITSTTNHSIDIPQKIYTVYSETHEVFKPWFESIVNVYPNIKIEYALIEQVCPLGKRFASGWTKATVQKLEKIIEIFDDPENNQDYFIYSDIDVQFFNPFHDEILKKLEYNDIVFQSDGPSSVCTGFFACRKTNKCKDFFISVLNELKQVEKIKPETEDDQTMTQHCLNKNVDIKYTRLSNDYFNYRHSLNYNNKITPKLWTPYTNIALPSNIYLHHANWTKGIENKILLLEYVKLKKLSSQLKLNYNLSQERKDVRIHAFIFNWSGHYDNTINLEKEFSENKGIYKVTIINSDINNKKDHWVNISEDDYFGDQFKKALELFDGDIFFHTQGDITFDDWSAIIDAVTTNFNIYEYGIYAPNVDFTSWDSERVDKKIIDFNNLREVSMTDCSCWAIHHSIIKEFKSKYINDILLAKYGYGIDVSMCAMAVKNSMLVLRDYNFTVNNPKHTGYLKATAKEMMGLYYDSLKNKDINLYNIIKSIK